jgi:hypothetical protein
MRFLCKIEKDEICKSLNLHEVKGLRSFKVVYIKQRQMTNYFQISPGNISRLERVLKKKTGKIYEESFAEKFFDGNL